MQHIHTARNGGSTSPVLSQEAIALVLSGAGTGLSFVAAFVGLIFLLSL